MPPVWGLAVTFRKLVPCLSKRAILNSTLPGSSSGSARMSRRRFFESSFQKRFTDGVARGCAEDWKISQKDPRVLPPTPPPSHHLAQLLLPQLFIAQPRLDFPKAVPPETGALRADAGFATQPWKEVDPSTLPKNGSCGQSVVFPETAERLTKRPREGGPK